MNNGNTIQNSKSISLQAITIDDPRLVGQDNNNNIKYLSENNQFIIKSI